MQLVSVRGKASYRISLSVLPASVYQSCPPPQLCLLGSLQGMANETATPYLSGLLAPHK